MKNLFLIAFLFFSFSISYGQTLNYVSFQAEIANRNNDFINIISSNGTIIKKIELNKNGVFKDTLKIKEGLYRMNDGEESTDLYLRNGYNLKLKMDAKEFDESIVYSGIGALENNILPAKALEIEHYYDINFRELDEKGFENLKNKIREENEKALNDDRLNLNFVAAEKENTEKALVKLSKYFIRVKSENKLNNTTSASFDYVNHKGGKSKLEDFKGKYVYIDIWATWCGPCRAEIPYLQKIENDYREKNIVFVSISIDVAKDFEKWKKFVTEKKLDGVQLFADKDYNSDFILSYGVTSIPRFILIDPTGKVVKGDASRPSDLELQKELDLLLN